MSHFRERPDGEDRQSLLYRSGGASAEPAAGAAIDPAFEAAVSAAAAGARQHGGDDAAAQQCWLPCWTAAYAPGGLISVAGADLVCRRNGAGLLAPLVLHSPTNLQTPRHSATLDMSAGSRAIGHALRQFRAGGIILEYLPEDEAAMLAAAAPAAGLRCLAMPHAAIPVTDCSVSFERFIERRSKRERQRSRRLLRFADPPDGQLRFSVVEGGGESERLFEQCLALEQASWKGREGTAILDGSEDTRFYRNLARSLAASHRLRLALLHDQDGQLVAFEFCMLWGERLIALKTSCSEQHLDLSPGHILALLHIRHCCADPDISLYDVTGNGLTPAAHLLRYADRQEQLWRIILFAPGWRGRWLYFCWAARLRLRSVKRFLAWLRE